MSKHLSLAGEEAQRPHAARAFQSAFKQFAMMRLACPSETSPKLAARICTVSSCTRPNFLCSDNKCECAVGHRDHLEGGVVPMTDLLWRICDRSQLDIMFEQSDLEGLLSSATNLKDSHITGDSLRQFLLPPSSDQPHPTLESTASLNYLESLIPVLNTVAICSEEMRVVWTSQQQKPFELDSEEDKTPHEWTSKIILYSPRDAQHAAAAVDKLTSGLFFHQNRIRQLQLQDSSDCIGADALFSICQSFPLLNKLTLMGNRLVESFQAWPVRLTTLCLHGYSNWRAPQLPKLNVSFPKFTNLRTLELFDIDLSQQQLIEISSLPFLVDLALNSNKFEAEGFKHIFRLRLWRLRLERQDQVTDEVVGWLSKAPALRHLQILTITGCSNTADSVHYLKSLRCLTELVVGKFQKEILSIAQHLPALDSLSINKYPYNTGDNALTHVKGLEHLTSLQQLDISYNELPVGCLQVISTLSQLRELRILGFDLTSRDSCYMNRLTNLTTLFYSTKHTQVSSEWLGQLRNLEDLWYSCWELDLSFARQIPLLTKLRKVDISSNSPDDSPPKNDQTTLLECVRAISTLPLLSDISISHEFYSGDALWLLSRAHGLKNIELTVPYWTDLTELRRLNRAEWYQVTLGIDIETRVGQRRGMRNIEFDFLKNPLRASKNPQALDLTQN